MAAHKLAVHAVKHGAPDQSSGNLAVNGGVAPADRWDKPCPSDGPWVRKDRGPSACGRWKWRPVLQAMAQWQSHGCDLPPPLRHYTSTDLTPPFPNEEQTPAWIRATLGTEER